jgi:CxxC motif-containing protein (DUF1111 family)
MNTRSVSRLIAVASIGGFLAVAQPPRQGPPPQPAAPAPAAPAPTTPTPGARPLPGLTQAEAAAFNEGLSRFLEVDSVTGTQPGAAGKGLGPTFNLNSCVGCHSHPSVGGTSPATNPEVALATEYGATNTVPFFVTINGPVRVARFVSDGGVHDLYTITGRQDAKGCTVAQPNFQQQFSAGNLVFRIPTPVFGAGLIESIADSAILANKSANAAQKTAFGITGHENRNPNDGTISRFGWKAQNKSLLLFSGEAYNVEIGVTNELFPTERDQTAGCQFTASPEDVTDFTAKSSVTGMSDIAGFSAFMRWLAPLQPQPATASSTRGQQDFANIGCALCHNPTFTTGVSSSPSLSQKPVNLYSDLLVHHMGTGLADGITQGSAAGDEFRTAPLWGLNARLFFLHDGRSTDLTQAINAHQSTGSEANASVAAFNKLTAAQQQDLLAFLKAL